MTNALTVLSKWTKHPGLKLGILISAILFLYGPALKYSFFQDDFYTLAKSQAASLKDLFGFFLPGGEIYYRPLSMRFYFWLVTNISGPKAIVFHALSLSIHLLNAILIWRLLKTLTSNSSLGWLSSFIYATSSVHFLSLFWIAEVGLLLGITTYLVTLQHATEYLIKGARRSLIKTIFWFGVGLLTHEFIVTAPVAIVAVYLLKRQKAPKPSSRALIKLISSLISLVALYLIARFFLMPLPASGSYAINLNQASLKALFWYSLWSFNLAEGLKDQLEPGPRLNLTFWHTFPFLTLTTVLFLIAITVFLIGMSLAFYLRATTATKTRIKTLGLFSLVWFVATISLPLATPYHLYPLYGSLSLVAISTTIAASLWWLYPHRSLVATAFLFLWVAFSKQTLVFTEMRHWAVQEAKRVEQTFTASKQEFPTLPKGSTLVLHADYQIQEALYGDLGLQFLYRDPTLKTYFGPATTIMPDACKMEVIPTACLQQHLIFVLPQRK